MPHMIVEHSADLSKSHDMQKLANLMAEAAVATGIFPLAGTRVRMHPVTTFAMADGHPDNAFVAVVMRIGAGRDLEARKHGGQTVFDVVCDYFATEIDSGFMAVSLDMEINDPEVSFKRNGLAKRLNKEIKT
ncbi:MAG: 5-carboxymethyl-2-hydroxymuconate isomerase [Rhizobiaceae bacterium]